MLPFLRVFPIFLAVTGCGSTTVQPNEAEGWNKLEVFARCLERMTKAGIPADSGHGQRLDLENGLPRDDQTKLYSDGRFLIEIPAKAPAKPSEIIFGCSGNYKKRTLELVQLGDNTRSPRAGENWDY